MVSIQPLTNFCIYLDIDETLVHTSDHNDLWRSLRIMSDPKMIDLRDRHYVLNVEQKRGTNSEKMLWGTKRPHLEEFIKFCFVYFKVVVVWSAGIYEYVHQVVEDIFKNSQEPHAILTRINCVGNMNRLEKPIWKSLADFPELNKYIELDGTAGPDNVKNVFIIDDRRTSFSQNPNNGICIPVYEPYGTPEGLRKDDICLLQIMTWLMRPEVINSKDVRRLNKENIFNIPALNINMMTGHNIIQRIASRSPGIIINT